MRDKVKLMAAIGRAQKFAVRALKRQDDDAAFNSLKAIVHMYIRMQNYRKALDIIHLAKEIYPDF